MISNSRKIRCVSDNFKLGRFSIWLSISYTLIAIASTEHPLQHENLEVSLTTEKVLELSEKQENPIIHNRMFENILKNKPSGYRNRLDEKLKNLVGDSKINVDRPRKQRPCKKNVEKIGTQSIKLLKPVSNTTEQSKCNPSIEKLLCRMINSDCCKNNTKEGSCT